MKLAMVLLLGMSAWGQTAIMPCVPNVRDPNEGACTGAVIQNLPDPYDPMCCPVPRTKNLGTFETPQCPVGSHAIGKATVTDPPVISFESVGSTVIYVDN